MHVRPSIVTLGARRRAFRRRHARAAACFLGARASVRRARQRGSRPDKQEVVRRSRSRPTANCSSTASADTHDDRARRRRPAPRSRDSRRATCRSRASPGSTTIASSPATTTAARGSGAISTRHGRRRLQQGDSAVRGRRRRRSEAGRRLDGDVRRERLGRHAVGPGDREGARAPRWPPARRRLRRVRRHATGHRRRSRPRGRMGSGDRRAVASNPARRLGRRVVAARAGSRRRCTATGRTRVFQLGDRGGLRHIAGHEARVRNVVFTADNARLWSASNDGTARGTDLATGHAIVLGEVSTRETPALDMSAPPRPPNPHGIRSLQLTADGAIVATPGEDGTIALWDAHTGAPIRKLVGHTGRARRVVFTRDGRTAFSVGDTTLRKWDVATGDELAHVDLGGKGWDVALFGGESAIATENDNNRVMTWHTADLASFGRQPVRRQPARARDRRRFDPARRRHDDEPGQLGGTAASEGDRAEHVLRRDRGIEPDRGHEHRARRLAVRSQDAGAGPQLAHAGAADRAAVSPRRRDLGDRVDASRAATGIPRPAICSPRAPRSRRSSRSSRGRPTVITSRSPAAAA